MSGFCEGCQKVKTIPSCSEDVTVGTVSVLAGSVVAIIADEQTGREWHTTLTTGAAGQVVIDFSDFPFLSENFRYSLKVISGADLTNYNNHLPITVDAVAYDCLYLDFTNSIDNSTDELTGAAAITLEADV